MVYGGLWMVKLFNCFALSWSVIVAVSPNLHHRFYSNNNMVRGKKHIITDIGQLNQSTRS